MARPHKIWFREDRNSWYVQIRGKQHNLGPDKEEAERQFHALLAKQPQKAAEDSLAEMLDAYLDYCKERKAPGTTRWYKDYLQDFLEYLKSKGKSPGVMDPNTITPKVVRRWIADRGGAARTRITVIKTAYSWGQKEGWLVGNPLAKMERPPVKPRTEMVSLADFKKLIRAVKDRCFRRLLILSWEVGCGPSEAKALERRHLELECHRAVFPKEESKGKKRSRVIYFTEKAERIIRQQLASHEEPFVFLNKRGKRWTANAVRCRFKRLEAVLGRRYCAYLLRHSWATRKLKTTDSHVVAALAGHADTRMLDLHYSHMREKDQFLLDAARKKD